LGMAPLSGAIATDVRVCKPEFRRALAAMEPPIAPNPFLTCSTDMYDV